MKVMTYHPFLKFKNTNVQLILLLAEMLKEDSQLILFLFPMKIMLYLTQKHFQN